MFQKAIPVHPNGFKHMGNDRFAQECFVGYKYGTLYKLGIICERTRPEQYALAQNGEESKTGEEPMQVDESSDMQAATSNAAQSHSRSLDHFNMAEFARKFKKQTERPQEKQKVFPKNIKFANSEQIFTETGENILYVVPNTGESIVRRFKITDN